MKTASKVFIWIGMVLTFYLIFPIVVGVLALIKIEQAKNQEELKTLGILTAIFCSLLGGIFMLCIKEEELTPKTDMTPMFAYTPPPQPMQSSPAQPTPQPVQVEQPQKMQAFAPLPKTKAKKAPKEKEFVKQDNLRDLFITMSIFTMLILSVILIPLFFVYNAGDYRYKWTELFSGIISFVMVALAGVIFGLYFSNHRRFQNPILVLQSLFAAASVTQMVFSLLAWTEPGYVEWYEYQWVRVRPFYFISAFIAIILVALTISAIVLQLIKPKESESTIAKIAIYAEESKPIFVPKVPSKPNNPMEYELSELKRLFDASMITEEEHQKMRASIIAKYF